MAQLGPGAGKTQRAFLRAYRSSPPSGGPPIEVFDYRTSRSGRHANEFPGGWRGHLKTGVENAIRPFAMGKKNRLIAGSERAGKQAAAIQYLIGTAQLRGLGPAAWLRDTLEKLPAWPNRWLDELLPVRGSG